MGVSVLRNNGHFLDLLVEVPTALNPNLRVFSKTFLAIAVPIDIPDKNVFVSYNFESNYSTLSNITEIDEVLFPNLPVISSRQSRSITRELAYTVLETRFKEHGMNGRDCMLRNICEAAETPLHHNGLLDEEYYIAEADGQRGDCDRYLEDCPYSLFDLITRLVEIKSG
ncbi:Uncharacterized protein OBRU01_04213 [Operophtera brumata]|uniref:Uncharacterized protein n=1 Tax=Operophtera brumata TaxID=104452 RepID=A0A0L7LPM3_OPEBR|nr:Uncharacterized protein OBRU01_04213 [Operophtera brumata]